MGAKYPRAISEFQKALQLDPHLEHTKVLLALSYFDTGDIAAATPLLEKAYSLAPGNGRILDEMENVKRMQVELKRLAEQNATPQAH